MEAQVFIKNDDYRKALIPLLKKADLKYNFVTSIEELYYVTLSRVPSILILEDTIGTKLQMIDLIRDLRILFGVLPTFIMIGDDHKGDEIAHYLGQGLDNFFNFPFDKGLIEDYLFKSTKKEVCLPFKFRNVPSGGVPLQIKFDINVSEINSAGIHFETSNLVTKGLIFETNLDSVLDLDHCRVTLKVLQNSRSEDGNYENFAEFFELSDDLRKKMIYKLKHA